MVLTDCLRDCGHTVPVWLCICLHKSCVEQSVPFCPQQLWFELTYALCEWPHPDCLCGQEQSFLACLWLQIIPQGFIADKGPWDQDLRLGTQPAWECREKVSCRWMENCRQESRHQLPWAKHVQAIKSPILSLSPLKRARLTPTGMLVDWWNASQRPE